MHRVLVTGSAGVIGQAVCHELCARGYHVRGFDIQPTGGSVSESVQASITDPQAVRSAMGGMDSVVHLAATPNPQAEFINELVPNNLIGVYHIFEAARHSGIQRLVVASSGQVVMGLVEHHRIIQVEDEAAPTNHYGLLKLWTEQTAQWYASEFGLSIIAVRIGAVPRKLPTADPGLVPAPNSPKDVNRLVYLSRNDAGRFFAAAVETRNVDFSVLFAISRSLGRIIFDLEPAKRLIGYEPEDTYP